MWRLHNLSPLLQDCFEELKNRIQMTFIVDSTAVGGLVTQGVRASTAIVLTSFCAIIRPLHKGSCRCNSQWCWFISCINHNPGHRLQNNRRTRARESAPSSGKVRAVMAYQEEAVLSNIQRPAVYWSSVELVGLADATRAMPVKTSTQKCADNL